MWFACLELSESPQNHLVIGIHASVRHSPHLEMLMERFDLLFFSPMPKIEKVVGEFYDLEAMQPTGNDLQIASRIAKHSHVCS